MGSERRRRIWNGLLCAILLTVLAFVSGGCAADTYTVCSSGCNYTSIQAAINNATPGDTIEVHSGTYYENVNADRQLILRGKDTSSGKPVVDAGGVGSAITLSHDGIVLDGFTAINASNDPQAGILVPANKSVVINSTATSNYFGIYLMGGNRNTISKNEVSGNSFAGIYLLGSTHNNLTHNTANLNGYYGILLWSNSNNNTIETNTISVNKRGITLGYSNVNAVYNNTIGNNSLYGLEMQQPSNNNSISNNTIDNNTQYGVYIGIHTGQYSWNRITNNAITNSNYGLYAKDATNTSIKGNSITKNTYGMQLEESAHNLIMGNTIDTYSGTGISLYHNSPHNQVHYNNVSGGMNYSGNIGISLDWAHHTALTKNLVRNNRGWGIYIGGTSQYALVDQNEIVHNKDSNGIGITSSRNNVTNNTISSNGVGINLINDAHNNFIFNNTITSNSKLGIDLWAADNNTIAHNTLQGNGEYGLRIFEFSTANIIIENIVCENGISDFYLEGFPVGNTGDENTCGCPDGWSDEGTTGCTFTCVTHLAFDTGPGTYPSIPGTHNGTITPSRELTIHKLYTYPCPGTGGHTTYAAILYPNGSVLAEASWNGYIDDWHNLTFHLPFILHTNETYNFTIVTGSYPQIIHEPSWNATAGAITCTEFVDGNGKQHQGWIPAIRLH